MHAVYIHVYVVNCLPGLRYGPHEDHTGVLRVHPVELLRKRAFRAHYAIIGTRTYPRIREPGAVAMVFVGLQ